jgi:DNA-binding CsgD family transcriptional regulator
MQELGSLLELTTEARSRNEYVVGRQRWLAEQVGFDLLYAGAASPTASAALGPDTAGVTRKQVERCESESPRYWRDRLRLNKAILEQGGVGTDVDLLPKAARARMPFYREVIAGLGLSLVLGGVFRIGGRAVGALYLGRTSNSRFGAASDRLRAALPLLALGHEVHSPRLADDDRLVNARLSPREREVAEYVCLGLTNSEIGTATGIAPNTIRNHVASILRKTETANRTELASIVSASRSYGA